MSRGKKIDDKIKAKAQAMLITGEKVVFVAKELGLAQNTVQSWKKQLESDDEFVKVRDKIVTDRLNSYLITALECEGTALDIVKMKLESALIAERNRKILIENTIELNDSAELNEAKRNLQAVLPEALSDVVRAFGVMAEKVALMSGKNTHNVNLNGSVSVGLKFEDL